MITFSGTKHLSLSDSYNFDCRHVVTVLQFCLTINHVITVVINISTIVELPSLVWTN